MAGMEEKKLTELIEEVRRDYQIPPFFRDDGLKTYAREGEQILLRLNPYADITMDQEYRMLLKNYIRYAFYHRTNEWRQNYAQMILEWQLGSGAEND